jgi:DNA recombination-dependent growth factor C
MALRVHPTLNTYQEKIIIAMAYEQGIEPASIVKVSFGDKINSLSDGKRQYYLNLYETLSESERRNPTK